MAEKEEFVQKLFSIECIVRRIIEDDLKIIIAWCDKDELKEKMLEL